MGLSRRKFTREFKLSAVQRLEMGVPIAELARAIEVNVGTLHRWQKEHLKDAGNVFPGTEARVRRRIGKLERTVGRQVLEIDFLKGRLQLMEEQQRLHALSRKPVSTSGSKRNGKKKRTA